MRTAKPSETAATFLASVAAAKPGDLIRMKVMRGKQTHTVDVIIGKSPE